MATAGLSTGGITTTIDPNYGIDLALAIGIPGVIAFFGGLAACYYITRCMRRRREAKQIAEIDQKLRPLILTTAPSTVTDHSAVRASRFGSEFVIGRQSTTGLTVPLPRRMTLSRQVGLAVPKTPYLKGQEGMEMSVLDLGAAAVATERNGEAKSGYEMKRPATPYLQGRYGGDVPDLELGLPAQGVKA